MLKANKSLVFEKLFAVYNRNLLRRRFHSFEVSGLDFLLNKNLGIPLIIYCNHSSWWDGLLAFEISRMAGLHSFVMMEEKHLRKFFLFRLLGAFSVVRESPRKASESIDYASGILSSNPQSSLWIFPQGKILPNDLRPLRFYRGLAKIIKNVGKCTVASLAMRYEFLDEFKPRIYVRISEPESVSDSGRLNLSLTTDQLADRLTENLDALKADILNLDFTGYKTVF